jgi:hypothetical protein
MRPSGLLFQNNGGFGRFTSFESGPNVTQFTQINGLLCLKKSILGIGEGGWKVWLSV